MNDQQPVLQHPGKLQVTCQLPGCGKEVIHLSQHLKNMHSMSGNEYHLKMNRGQENNKQIEIKESQEELMIEVKNFKSDKLNKTEEGVMECYSEVLASDSEMSDCDEQANDREVNGIQQDEEEEGDREEDDIEEDDAVGLQAELSDDHLRYLVHNTTPDGVRFFLTSLRKGTTIEQYSHISLCKVTLGKLSISMLKDIYVYHKHLLSFYRMARYYPYPDKDMIHSYLACGASEKGKCSCPVLPKSFYVFARQKCLSDWNCKKCVNFDRTRSHACLDFFHCSRCHEEYGASTKYKPYP